jgi:exosortase
MASLALLTWAEWHSHYVLACFAWIALLAGILLYLEGWARLKVWLFPILFLVLAVPLPVVDRLSPWLEAFTAWAAAGLVRLAGIPVYQQGGEISLPGSTIVVGAPCSGLRSLVALFALGLVWVYVVDGKLHCKLALLVSIVPLTLASNVVRIAILLALAVWRGTEVAMGYYHTWSSPLLFVLSVGLLLTLGKVLGCARPRDDLF